jgi:hypothetical protein
MTQQQFHSLDLNSKILLLTDMPHIGERFEPKYTILLFQMSGWLLEAYFHRRSGAMHFETITRNEQLNHFMLLEKGIVLPDGTTATAKPGLLAYNMRKFTACAKQYIAGLQHLFPVAGARQNAPGGGIA